jgi:hypothetical protein
VVSVILLSWHRELLSQSFVFFFLRFALCNLWIPCFCLSNKKKKNFQLFQFRVVFRVLEGKLTGLFSESFHVITRSLVSFHDFFFWALVILFFLSVLDKFLWICLYFFDGRWLCSLRCVNILVRRAVKFFWIILELVGKFWSLFKF